MRYKKIYIKKAAYVLKSLAFVSTQCLKLRYIQPFLL